MEEIQQLIVWRQKMEDPLGVHGIVPQLGGPGEAVRDPRPDWRRNARWHPGCNYLHPGARAEERPVT